MESDFWLKAWASGETGFHRYQENPGLLKFWSVLSPQPFETVLVPMCGKSIDLIWLASQHQQVYGVEVSDIAVRALFAENFYTPTVTQIDSRNELYQFDEIDLYRGDFFTSPLPAVDLIYDRAALDSLKPEHQKAYAERLLSLLNPGGRMLLITGDWVPSEPDPVVSQLKETDIRRLFPGSEVSCLSDGEGETGQSKVWVINTNLDN